MQSNVFLFVLKNKTIVGESLTGQGNVHTTGTFDDGLAQDCKHKENK